MSLPHFCYIHILSGLEYVEESYIEPSYLSSPPLEWQFLSEIPMQTYLEIN